MIVIDKIIYISPHLDDVILSCGGKISNEIKNNKEVYVVSIFTSCGDSSDDIKKLYKKRRNDDIKASIYLGYKYMHLNKLDAPFRNKKYNNFYNIMFDEENIDNYNEIAFDIASSIVFSINKLNPDHLFFPLGIGGHIDHKIIFQVSLILNKKYNIKYYEDRPYSFLTASSSVRWVNLKAKSEKTENKKNISPNWEKFDITFLKNYMIDEEDADKSFKKLKSDFLKLKEIDLNTNAWNFMGKVFHKTTYKLDSFSSNKLINAILFYETEIPSIFNIEINNDISTKTKNLINLYKKYLGSNTKEDLYEITWE